MKLLFLGFSYFFVAVLVFLMLRLFKRKDRLAFLVKGLLGLSAISIVTYSLLMWVSTFLAGNIAMFVHAALLDFLMFFLVMFACEYTRFKGMKKLMMVVFIPLMLLDEILLGYSAFSGQLVRFKSVNSIYSSEVLLPVHWNAAYLIHIVITYAFVITSLVILITKGVIERAKHKPKYYVIVASVMISAILYAVFILMNPIYNPANLFIAMSAVVIYYYCFVYEPKVVSDEITKYVIAELDEMVVCFDSDNECSYVNKKTIETLGENAYADAEKKFSAWLKEYPAFNDWNDEIHEWQKETKIGENNCFIEFSLKKQYDNVGNYIGCYIKMKDNTELKNEFANRQKTMMMDPLTGVYRREHFFREVRKTLDANPNKKYYIVCSNIADFKIYNSVFGEEQGNVVLKNLADRLGQFKRVARPIGRVSGDVFGGLVEKSIFSETPLLHALDEFQSEFSTSQYKLKVQVGIYEINDITEPVSSMCEKANLVMKAGKKSLNQTVFYFKEKEISGLLGAKQVISRFDDALEKKQFLMYLQPQVTADGEVLGCEALCRWLDDGNQLIPPNSFIPVLEEHGLITKLDMYIWEQAAMKLAQWKNVGREDIYISVNISGKDFYYVDVYEEFTSLVEKYNLNPRRLKLEVTETAIVQDMEAMIKLVGRLRDYGFEVEIDDFGSGYSSLGMLKDLEVDVLKLDMSFLRKASESKEERMWIIMNQMANMAESLGMGTVVEGVEDLEQVRRLSEMGCRVFQGYYFAQPEPVAAFEHRAKVLC